MADEEDNQQTTEDQSTTATAQDDNTPDHRMCATMEVHNRLLEEFPECRARRAEISAALEARLSEDPSFRRTCGLTTIPVVVHVVYNTDTENIADDQITSQIDALNRDYRANNSDMARSRCMEEPCSGSNDCVC
jgi:hypothetical protein